MATDASNFEKMVRIPYQKDHFNPVRTEYSTMLRRQLAQEMCIRDRSAIASAAYRAGERLYSEYYGEYSDYTRNCLLYTSLQGQEKPLCPGGRMDNFREYP